METETEMEELTIRTETTMVIRIMDFNRAETEMGTITLVLDLRTETTMETLISALESMEIQMEMETMVA